MAALRDALRLQKVSNDNALPHWVSFESHRRQLTQLVQSSPRPASAKSATLCVLGAGNCFDLELTELAEHYAQIHLVDLDAEALSRARERQPKEVQARLVLHGNVDVSGSNAVLDDWCALKVRPEQLMDFPARASEALAHALPGPFDRVVSACVLSQLLLTLRRVLSERHPLFGAASLTLSVAHLRALARLTKQQGSALFATDISSDEIAPLSELRSDEDMTQLLSTLSAHGKVFNALEPHFLETLVRQDPVLERWGSWSPPRAAWLWRNGPQRTFLVYAAEFTPRALNGVER